jgi:hypothetical protein
MISDLADIHNNIRQSHNILDSMFTSLVKYVFNANETCLKIPEESSEAVNRMAIRTSKTLHSELRRTTPTYP